jgi:multidrug efflux pump subunit AcrA (membrane-fusion protein)
MESAAPNPLDVKRSCRILGGLFLLSLPLLLPACSGVRSAERTEAVPESAPQPLDLPDLAGRLPGNAPGRTILLTGELRAVRNEEIRTPLTDTWPLQIRWMIPEGTLVREGQKVLDFDNTAVLSRLEEMRLARLEAAVSLRSTEAQLEAQRAEKSFAFEKAKIVLEKAALEAAVPEPMRARRDYDAKQLELERARTDRTTAERDLAAFERSAEADLQVARLELAKAERQVTRAEETLRGLSCTAPRAGVLLYGDHPWEARKFQEGDNAFPRMTIMKVPDLSRMEIVAWLSDVDDGALSAGRPVRCLLDSYPDRSFEGRIREVAPVAEERGRDTGIRAFRVSIDLDGADPAFMRPGMSVKVEVLREQG